MKKRGSFRPNMNRMSLFLILNTPLFEKFVFSALREMDLLSMAIASYKPYALLSSQGHNCCRHPGLLSSRTAFYC